MRRGLIFAAALATAASVGATVPAAATTTWNLNANLDWGSIQAYNAPSTIRFRLFDAPGGVLLLDESIAPEGDGVGPIHVQQYGVDLSPGMELRGTDADGQERSLVVADLTIERIDEDAEVVHGTGPAGADVYVYAAEIGDGGEIEYDAHDVIDPSGIWSGDLGADGADLSERTFEVSAYAADGDGDGTIRSVGAGSVSWNSRTEALHLFGFPGSTLRIRVFDQAALIHQSYAGGNAGETRIPNWELGGSLQVGRRVEVRDGNGPRTRTLTLHPVSITYAEFIEDRGNGEVVYRVIGTADPGMRVVTGAESEAGGGQIDLVMANAQGIWESIGPYGSAAENRIFAGVGDSPDSGSNSDNDMSFDELEADGAPPVATIDAGDPAVVIGPLGDQLSGHAFDAASGVAEVFVTFYPLNSIGTEMTVTALRVCDGRNACTWTSPARTGVHHVVVRARDRRGNIGQATPPVLVIGI